MDEGSGAQRPRPVADYLMESMRAAGVTEAFMVLAPGKWDIPACFGNGNTDGWNLAYLIRDLPYGVPFTLDAAFPFVGDRYVVFGFPDIIFSPVDAISRLIARQETTGADVVLGVFQVDQPSKWDGIEFGADGKIATIHPKPHNSTLGYTWILAVWKPTFSLFMHRFVEDDVASRNVQDSEPGSEDVSLGIVLQAALKAGLHFEHVTLEDGYCLDIGTPEDLSKALTALH